MTKRLSVWLAALAVCLWSVAAIAQTQPERFEFHDNDRVALVGNTFIERAAESGYIETALLTRVAAKNLTFRNLGWSGDTVLGEARARFGTPQDGFDDLHRSIDQVKPTVIFVYYGTSESFGSSAKLAGFKANYARILDMLGSSGARLVLITPIRQEHLAPPLPDPARHNQDLALYAGAIRELAAQRHCACVDLFNSLIAESASPVSQPLTDDSEHLTAAGYRAAADQIASQLGYPAKSWNAALAGDGVKATGAEVQPMQASDGGVMAFNVTDAQLPLPPAPDGAAPAAGAQPRVAITGLPGGMYSLLASGITLAHGTSEQFASGATFADPAGAQSEEIRRLVVAKNQDFFNRWRPQNETYIFGFRKHEQGRHASEIPEFDTLIAQKESQIETLRAPKAVEYVVKKD